ncbi:MAG: mechanosensitive ion channel [Gammaproteobacteria bacterium]|nr:mechanosensitive ion channel [Gammaproteobacteria bacterium]
MDYQNLLASGQELLALYGLKVLGALVVLILGRWVARLLANLLRRGLARAKVDETLSSFIVNVAYVALLVFVVISALGQLGMQTTSFIAVIGAAGLAIGLAFQGSLANFAAGALMIMFRPFRVGDFIEAGGVAGVVEEIQIVTTKLRTGDNKTVYVPNNKIMGDSITNYSAKETRRIDLVFGVGYEDDLQQVKTILQEILAADERVLKDPAPTIGVLALADSSVNFAVRPWVATADYWSVYFDLNETVKRRFDAAGISIPYPQRDVHIKGQQAA